MAVSQFTIYRSSDASAPALSGTAGTLLSVLDAVLVNGYGSKAAAGWSKPIANASNIGCYKNGTGSSQMNLVVNDAGVTAAGVLEADVAGWETLAGIATPIGSGGGQFPLAAQMTNGYAGWRKSTTVNSTARSWLIAADKYTFHMWIDTGSTGYYTFYTFGDIFSLKPTTDTYRCLLIGGLSNQSTTNYNNDQGDMQPSGYSGAPVNLPLVGHYMPRSWGGGGASVSVTKLADGALAGSVASILQALCGAQAFGPENALYISPIKIHEISNGAYRGRMRGLYCSQTTPSALSNGQTFSATGDYAGKTLQVVKGSQYNACWLVETSNTVETN